MQCYLASTVASLYDAFLDKVWQELVGPDEAVPDEATGELPTSWHPVAYAISKSQRFAAFRWYLPSSEDPMLIEGLCDVFLVPTASAETLRLGIAVSAARARSLEGQISSAALAAVVEWARSHGLGLVPAPKPLPGFIELCAMLASRGQLVSSSAQALAKIQEVQAHNEYLEQLVVEQETEIKQLQASVEQLREALIWSGSSRPVAQRDAPAPSEEALSCYPDSLGELGPWVQDCLGERIAVLPRALNGAKKSIYERPHLVYACLEFLAGPYRDSRLGLIDAAAVQAALDKLGVRLRGSVGASIAGEQGDEYYVTWRGRRRFLDMHLLRGGGRDERYCLRIYFFWDDETQRCVVGWLPSHLSNSLS